MGTNYYRRSIPTAADYRKLAGLVKEAPISEAQEFISEMEQEVHIGKSSAGWQFLFNMNGRKYYNSRTELLAWLEAGLIVDEYGREYSMSDFWEGLENRMWNGRQAKTHRSESIHPSDYIVIDGLEFLDCYFS